MQEKAIEEQMVAVKDVVMEPTMKTLSDDLVQTLNLLSLPWRKSPRRWPGSGVLGS